jgi:hypothetical protein
VLLSLPPLRLVFDFRQNVRSGYRIKRLTLIKRVRRSVAKIADVGEKFSCPALGHDAGHMLTAACAHDGNFYLGKFFLKSAVGNRVPDFGKTVKHKLSFLLRRSDSLLPLVLPRCPALRCNDMVANGKSGNRENNQRCNQRLSVRSSR